jgi:hypothetical protein
VGTSDMTADDVADSLIDMMNNGWNGKFYQQR